MKFLMIKIKVFLKALKSYTLYWRLAGSFENVSKSFILLLEMFPRKFYEIILWNWRFIYYITTIEKYSKIFIHNFR